MYPIHIKFIEIKPRNQIIVMGMLYVIALIIHRPVDELNVIQSVVYFTPPYLLGIFCSIHKTFIYTRLKGKEFLFLIAVVALATIQALLARYDNYQKLAFVYDGIDLILLQKSFLCVFFMLFLYRFEGSKNKLLTLLASTSFAIYFIHGYVLQVLTLAKSKLVITVVYPWATYFFTGSILIIISILLALFLKKLFPKYSQYITGY